MIQASDNEGSSKSSRNGSKRSVGIWEKPERAEKLSRYIVGGSALSSLVERKTSNIRGCHPSPNSSKTSSNPSSFTPVPISKISIRESHANRRFNVSPSPKIKSSSFNKLSPEKMTSSVSSLPTTISKVSGPGKRILNAEFESAKSLKLNLRSIVVLPGEGSRRLKPALLGLGVALIWYRPLSSNPICSDSPPSGIHDEISSGPSKPSITGCTFTGTYPSLISK